jgi:hypothetical protein
MEKVEFYVSNQKNNILTNQYGLYSYKYHSQTGGPGFHSQFKLRVQPNYSGKENTITLQFSENLNHFETVIKNDFICEGFKNGTKNFVHKLEEEKLGISDPIKIEIVDYHLHTIDSGRIYNQICIEQALNHIYQSKNLSPKTEFNIEFKEYDKIYIELANSKGVRLNNELLLWGTNKAVLLERINLPFTYNEVGAKIKHFNTINSINFANTILDRAYNLDIGFNANEEFTELSLQKGFDVKVNELTLKYFDPILNLLEKAKDNNDIFIPDGRGNYLCKELGITISESSYKNNKHGNGMLEYIYLTKPKLADNNR